jgi:peptidoglycan/LPS O-acetylase OafA/YrhL
MSAQNDTIITYPSDAVKAKYYPSLNGLRGISILLVVAYHLGVKYLNGPLGVSVFFVLSGFLITTLCINELNLTNKLSLSNFYLRRSLRILPVAYLYLAVILLFNLILGLGIAWFQFAGSALYVMNFSYFRSHEFTWHIAHFWSLSVEEQFYLIFPVILKFNRRLFTLLVAFIVFILPLFCFLQFMYPQINHGIPYYFSHYLIKFQAISVGCLLSVLTFNKTFDYKYLADTKLAGNLVAVFLIFYLKFDDFYSIQAVFTNCAISLLVGYLIISNIIPSDDIIFKLLNFKPLTIIGLMSYSIYLWQQLFTSRDPHFSDYIVTFPYNIIWIILVPYFSYFYYEKYFLKLKKRFKTI